MRTYKTQFKHGQFIDTETGKRIIPVQGATYEITGDIDSFKEDDEKFSQYTPLATKDKEKYINDKFVQNNVRKMADAGTQLFFRIGNSKKIIGDESKEYIFTCRLLEDLYMFKNTKSNGNEPKHWKLCDCVCILESCIDGKLVLTEKISGLSLNILFAFTVAFYFNMQRSTACNAFKTFNFYEKEKQITRDGIMNEYYKNLDEVRKKIVFDYYKK
jgi:hypothetical protein